jgi:hypothetical protein
MFAFPTRHVSKTNNPEFLRAIYFHRETGDCPAAQRGGAASRNRRPEEVNISPRVSHGSTPAKVVLLRRLHLSAVSSPVARA